MDWNREAERDMLERILALLLALAGLADRASGLPALARLPVLAILGRGEAVARAFVLEYASAAPSPARADAAPSPAAGDAVWLAASFRALALVLGAMLGGEHYPARSRGAAGPHARMFSPSCQSARSKGRRVAAPPAPDTS